MLLAVPFGAFHVSSVSAEFRVTPRFEARETYTDNVNLDANDGSDDFVTRLSPGFTARGNGRRYNFFTAYTLNGFIFARNTDENDIRHNLAGRFQSELLEDRLFLNASATVNQQFRDIGGAVSGSQANFTGNRATIQNYNFSPRFQQRFGREAVFTASYLLNFTELGDDTAEDGTPFLISDALRQRVQAGVNSGPAYQRFTWGLNGSFDTVDRSNNPNTFEAVNIIANGSYNYTRRLALLASVGYEDISDATLGALASEGVIWDLGVRITPGTRSQLEVRGGQRFGSAVFSGVFSYRLSENTTFRASYSENVQLFNRLVSDLADGFDGLDDFDFSVVIDENGVPVTVATPGFSLTDVAFTRQRADSSFISRFGRNRVSLTAFFEDRSFADQDDSATTFGFSTNVRRDLSRQAVFSFGTNYLNIEFLSERVDNFITGFARYEYKFTEDVVALLQYRHTTRGSNIDFFDLSENTISASIRFSF
ncbi:MAG: TIGR03016 family PEP-CTERM system-associated outer membrane protein [Pseudomonadota bacterium]